jgi:hypothetical protein
LPAVRLAFCEIHRKIVSVVSPILGDQGSRAGLTQVCRQLDGSKELVLELAAEGTLPPICVRAIEHRLTPRDLVQLELLRKGLDGISPPRGWREKGRPVDYQSS